MARKIYGVLGRIRDELERDLESETFSALFKRFARRSRHAASCRGWTELIAFLQSRLASPEVEDELLADLRSCYLEERGPLWHSVMTLVFLPALSSIHAKTRRWADSAESLWSDLHWSFLQAIPRTDPASCRAGIARKLYDKTYDSLRRIYRKEWDRRKRAISTESPDLAGWDPGSTDAGLAALETRERGEYALERLRALAEAGAFPEDDLELFMETRVRGIGLDEAAKARGISYQAAKKRCQRMAGTIHRALAEK